MAMKEPEFLAEIADLVRSLRSEIEAWKVGLDPSPEAVAGRRRRVLTGDFRFFAYTYFPHHIRGEPSTFQKEFCERFPKLLLSHGGCKEWWVAPRGEAKSSLLTKIGPVYIAALRLLQREEVRKAVGWEGPPPPDLDYITLLGAETRMPTKLMEVAKTELTVNATLQMDFPEICGRGPVWKVGEFVTVNGVKVEPYGAEQAIRGTFFGASRPKVLLGDDLITDKEAKSPTERENRWNWLEKAIDYLGPPDGTVKFLAVGTILNTDDPISRAKATIGHQVHHYKAIEAFPARMDLWERCEELMRNEDKKAEQRARKRGRVLDDEDLPSYRFYLKHKRAMDRGARTSWPSVRSLYWLMRQRAKNRRAFGTEMQGEARNDEDQVFNVDNLKFWVQVKRHWIWYGGCDPSMGKGETSDPSAILVGAWCTERLALHVEHAGIKRRVPSKLQADLIAAQQEYPIVLWGFENNGAFEHSRQSFVEAALRAGVTLPLYGITATAQAGGEVWIDSLEPFVNGGRILFRSSLHGLIDELRDWPNPQPHHHYDGLVALYLLWAVASSGAGGLPRIASRRARAADTLRGYD